MKTERPQVKQDRAVRTRRAILEAAAVVFEEHGYDTAKLSDIVNIAKVTKGALYFHFDSKEGLAQAVIDAQNESQPQMLPQQYKVQEFVDIGMVFSHRLRHEALMRASTRLTLEYGNRQLDRAAPYQAWIELLIDVLAEAQRRGELLPNVDPVVPARLIVGAYAGLNSMSHTLGLDLDAQVSELYTHVMPNVVVPALAIRLDTAPGRGARALFGPQGTHECRQGCQGGVPPREPAAEEGAESAAAAVAEAAREMPASA
ncbi:ScbR family autoregulator-binding transcription factor [Streptomyces sp. NBC_00091]|uniref:ScbR family autoregulator-binding transcription factor n=1 Tax=Streptomyces sp. NBC_00091 TaxID=2975648 RepID=UPI00224E9AEA|nr:ScbR family autoregulator-binding transcription factor [Streptomyces sp. NBC_00091]MCX5377453.1 ScbR family autoregulator-binding transcription factor [Streptomyces sp. NBC_00091]